MAFATPFQAQLSILSEGHVEEGITGQEEWQGVDLVDLCKNVISAFDSLRNTNEYAALFSLVYLYTDTALVCLCISFKELLLLYFLAILNLNFEPFNLRCIHFLFFPI